MTGDPAAIARADISRLTDIPPSPRAKSTENRTVYAIGDVHGCYAQLVGLLEAIVSDIVQNAGAAPPLLVFCGDYVDRGPASASVLSALVWLSRHAVLDVVFLRGNHEVMLLDFLDQPDQNLPWLRRDGVGTLASYGVALKDGSIDTLEADCFALRDQLMDRIPASHLTFLRGLPVTATYGDYVFVHAGFRPGVPLARQDDEDCLWIGDEFLSADYRFDKVVVHGHSWRSDTPMLTRNRIGIDTGAYSTGVLTAVRLEGARIAFLQSRLATATGPASATLRADHGSGAL